MKSNGVPPAAGERKRGAAAPPDPEVSAKATRRRFTPQYKLSIVEQADECESPGDIGRDLPPDCANYNQDKPFRYSLVGPQHPYSLV